MHRPLDIEHEQLISLKEVPKHLPRRNGKRTHYSTVFRWATRGARGRKLESVLLGGVRYTSLEALGRFAASATMVDADTGDVIAQILARDGL
jgi:hypothetical protein